MFIYIGALSLEEVGVLMVLLLARAATSALSRAGRPVELLFSRERGHGTALARQAVIEGAAVVVACGGDGTIAEMLPALSATGVRQGDLDQCIEGVGTPGRCDLGHKLAGQTVVGVGKRLADSEIGEVRHP